MNPTTLRLALRGAKQVRKALQKRQDEVRNQHFDSLEALRKSLQDDPERELVLANSPAHVHAIAEQMRKEDGAAEALNKARAAAAARAVAEGADTSEIETNDVAELASVHKPLTKKQEKQLAAAKKKEEKLRKKNAKAQARVEKLQGRAKALKGDASARLADATSVAQIQLADLQSQAKDRSEELSDRLNERTNELQKRSKKLKKQASKDAEKRQKAAQKQAKKLRKKANKRYDKQIAPRLEDAQKTLSGVLAAGAATAAKLRDNASDLRDTAVDRDRKSVV